MSIDFSNLQGFVNFMGWARTGHSLVGSLLDAHPNCVVSHELFVFKKYWWGYYNGQYDMFQDILEGSQNNYAGGRFVSEGYFQAMKNTYQGGGTTNLQLIGDKKGGGSLVYYRDYPEIIDSFQEFIGIPVKYIMVVRNPMDSFATSITKRPYVSVEERMDRYEMNFQYLRRFLDQYGDITHVMRHEDLVLDFGRTFKKLLRFLDLPTDKKHHNACKQIMFKTPRKSRYKIEWAPWMVDRMYKMTYRYSFLNSYMKEVAKEQSI